MGITAIRSTDLLLDNLGRVILSESAMADLGEMNDVLVSGAGTNPAYCTGGNPSCSNQEYCSGSQNGGCFNGMQCQFSQNLVC